MVVIAIISLIASFTFAELSTNSYKLKTVAQSLKANMNKARLLSVKKSSVVYVDFDLDSDGGSDGTINKFYTLWCDLDKDQKFTMEDQAGNSVSQKKDSVEFIEDIPLASGAAFGVVSSSDGGPTKGPPAQKSDPPSSGPNLPGDGVSYGGDRVRFTPWGKSTSGWAYLHIPNDENAGTYAVGTNNIGRIRSTYFATNGGRWRW